MRTSISRVLGWDLERVAGEMAHLRTDESVFRSASGTVRTDTARTLEGMSGRTVDAVRDDARTPTGDLADLADVCRSVVRVLTDFHCTATVARTALVREREAALAAGFEVTDDGFVEAPRRPASPADASEAAARRDEETRVAEHERVIQEHLRTLDAADTTAANGLRAITGGQRFGGDHSDNADPKSNLGGGAVSAITDPFATAAGASAVEPGAGASTVRGLSRGAPLVGAAVGLGIGLWAAPDGEALPETLAAEGAGAVAGMAAGAATGALLGSTVPFAGTIAGAVVGGIAGYLTSEGMREHFDDQRDDGVTPFASVPGRY